MAKMSAEVQELFKTVPTVSFATADADGQPNANIVAMKAVIDDETLYLSDQFFKKTLANLEQNNKVAILFFKDRDAIQIHGTARYVNEGEEFEAQAAWVNAAFEKMGMPVKAKGGCFVTVDAVYSAASGPAAGEQLA